MSVYIQEVLIEQCSSICLMREWQSITQSVNSLLSHIPGQMQGCLKTKCQVRRATNKMSQYVVDYFGFLKIPTHLYLVEVSGFTFSVWGKFHGSKTGWTLVQVCVIRGFRGPDTCSEQSYLYEVWWMVMHHNDQQYSLKCTEPAAQSHYSLKVEMKRRREAAFLWVSGDQSCACLVRNPMRSSVRNGKHDGNEEATVIPSSMCITWFCIFIWCKSLQAKQKQNEVTMNDS